MQNFVLPLKKIFISRSVEPRHLWRGCQVQTAKPFYVVGAINVLTRGQVILAAA